MYELDEKLSDARSADVLEGRQVDSVEEGNGFGTIGRGMDDGEMTEAG